MAENETFRALLSYGDGHSGRGWYYADAWYPEDGSVGAFETKDEAKRHAQRYGEYDSFEEPPNVAEVRVYAPEWRRLGNGLVHVWGVEARG